MQISIYQYHKRKALCQLAIPRQALGRPISLPVSRAPLAPIILVTLAVIRPKRSFAGRM